MERKRSAMRRRHREVDDDEDDGSTVEMDDGRASSSSNCHSHDVGDRATVLEGVRVMAVGLPSCATFDTVWMAFKCRICALVLSYVFIH